jgi:2-hydroxy-4-carboxymuconate semialdehyde hemiacetal dehydrogenase
MSERPVRIALAGVGAFGLKHLDALSNIDGACVVSLVEPQIQRGRDVAARYGIGHVCTELAESVARPDVDAVILCTPTPQHARQAIECLAAGKHVQVEIPLADSWLDAMEVLNVQRETGLVAMCGHTRRFNPSHQFIRRRVASGAFTVQQLNVQTHFFRRTNVNALGQPRDWTDHLLWHHAAHTVDLFAWQCGSPIVRAQAMQGPIDDKLHIALDMGIQLKAANGALCTLSLSFNNDGPLGTVFRYIGDSATYVARYDDLFDGGDRRIDVSDIGMSTNGIELQDREFVAAIREGRQPVSSVRDVLPCYEILHQLAQQLECP